MKVVYTDEQRREAVAKFRRCHSYTKTCRELGYPSLHTLRVWVSQTRPGKKRAKKRKAPRRYGWQIKLEAVERMEGGQRVDHIAKDLKIDVPVLIYQWRTLWKKEGRWGLMTKHERRKAAGFVTESQLRQSLPDDVEQLRSLAARLMVEKAVLEQQVKMMGKDLGGIPDQLPNSVKTTVVDTLRSQWPLALLVDVLGLPPSSYYYHRKVKQAGDKYEQLRVLIKKIALENHYVYGSRRIWIALRKCGQRVSEKIVRRVMKEERIAVYYAKKKRRYSSYEGEVSPAPEDLVKHDFHADEPNQLWLTDVSEFAGPDGKVYFSPIIDCFDGKIVAYRCQRDARKTLTQAMLEDGIAYLTQCRADPCQLVLHSDRGGHYRCKEWLARTEQVGIQRSMSRKGCSPDNARCEGFFGTMKTEMFYGRQWQSVSQIEEAIDWYIDWYNNVRIKTELGGLTIKAHREKMKEHKNV